MPDDMEDNQELDVEQAFINYALSDNLSLKAGRFLSYSGWETEEPTGLFQYSGTGYAGYFYGGYQQGVSGLYTGDGYAVAVSVVNDLGGEIQTLNILAWKPCLRLCQQTKSPSKAFIQKMAMLN